MTSITLPTGTTVTADTFTCIDPSVCDPCYDRLPVARSVKSRASRAAGSKHEVNSGEARSAENKVAYQVPTCFGPVKIKSSQASRAERSSQVKSSNFARASNTVQHKAAGF